MTQKREDELLELENVFIEESFAGGDTETGVIGTHHPDFVGHWFLPGGADFDREELAAFIDSLHEGVSDLTMEPEFMVAGNDTVAFGFTLSGRHDGELMGVPATGKEISWTGVGAHRYAGDEVIEGWGVADGVSLLQQIGAMD